MFKANKQKLYIEMEPFLRPTLKTNIMGENVYYLG